MANFTALKTAINNAIKTNGNEEITGAVLQAILDAMVETLGESAINDLENAITTEVTNRENAVGDVATDLAAEALARANKDNQLDGRINQEEYNRANADAALSQTMSQGFQTLNSQMTALNAAISALNAAYQNGYLYGGIATPSSSPSNNKCFYIALQGGTYTNFGGVGVVEGINIIKNDSGWKVEHIYDQTTLLNEFYLLRQQVIRALASYEPIVVYGDVTNAPDEEDLTSNAQHLLKFKDRDYSPLNFSGLGMKILRKNILPLNDSVAFNGFLEGVTAEETLAGSPELIFWDRMNTRFVGIKDGIYYAAWTDDDNYVPVSTSLVYMYDGTPYKWDGSNFSVDEDEVPNLQNCLTQDMINEDNTVYIIRYDFTLREDITIPANCVLQFDGGSISGEQTITGTNTGIQAGLVKIFSTDVTLAGTWNVAEFYPEWFGAKGDGETDDTIAIQKCFRKNMKWWQTPNMGKKNVPSYTVKFSPKTYIITDDIIIWSGIDCNLGNAIIKQTNSAKNAFVFRHDNGYQSYGCWNSRIENGIIVGVGKATSTGYGIRCERLNGGVISNVEVYDFKIGIALLETQYTLIERVFTHSNRVGVYLSSMADSKNLPTIDNTLIEVSSGSNEYGVWLQKCSFNNFYTLDSGRNSKADVLFGAQLTGYIKSINVTNGGSGYPASSNLPLTITDANGIDAECYAVTNAQGVITSCIVFTSGIKYSNPSVAVNADSGSGASFTVELGNDSGIGEWDGANAPINSGNRIYNLKIEHILADKPITGYDIIMNNDDWDNNYIYNVVGDLQGGSNYSKLALINGPLTINDICFPDRTNGFVNPYTGDNYVVDVTNTRVYLTFNYYFSSINQVKWINASIKSLCSAEYIRPQTGRTIMRGNIVNTRPIIDESGNIKGNLLCYVDANEVESTRGKGVILYDNVTKNIGFAKNDSIVYDAWGYLNKSHRGASTNRPTGLINVDRDKGFLYFDTTLGKPIWWNGSNWVDSTGATV